MIIDDLPTDANLTKVKVKLPDNVLELLQKESTGSAPEMYLVGFLMGDFFLSPDPPTENRRKLCPVLGLIPVPDILKWEIVQ